MLEAIHKHIRDSAVMAIVIIAFCGVGIFGFMNWFAWMEPMHPVRRECFSDVEYEFKIADYQRRLDKCGADAVVSRLWAMTLTGVGVVGAIGFGIVLANKDSL